MMFLSIEVVGIVASLIVAICTVVLTTKKLVNKIKELKKGKGGA